MFTGNSTLSFAKNGVYTVRLDASSISHLDKNLIKIEKNQYGFPDGWHPRYFKRVTGKLAKVLYS